jgi:hypothetical protein
MKKVQDTIIFKYKKNRPKILTIFPHEIRRVLSDHHKKKRKTNSFEILNCEHITSGINTLKIEYLGPGSL